MITTSMIADAVRFGSDIGNPFNPDNFIPNSEIWAAYCMTGGSFAGTARFFNDIRRGR